MVFVDQICEGVKCTALPVLETTHAICDLVKPDIVSWPAQFSTQVGISH